MEENCYGVNQSESYYRAQFSQYVERKRFSASIVDEILHLFNAVPDEKKEKVASWIYPEIMRKSTTEENVIAVVSKTIEKIKIVCKNRTRFLQTLEDIKVSRSTIHDIMLLFGILKSHQQKELAAEKGIALVKTCKNEQEILHGMKTTIEQIVRSDTDK